LTLSADEYFYEICYVGQ